MVDISASDYRQLLQNALPSSVDTDTAGIDRSTLVTPDSHRSALDPNATIVKGARGVGKTYWFQSLLNQDLRMLAAEEYQLPRLHQIDPLVGFSTRGRSSERPGPRTLAKFLQDRVSPLDIWTAVGLTAFGVPEIKDRETWTDRLRWLEGNPEEVEQALDSVDTEAERLGVTRLLLFDALEHLHHDRETADKLVSGILEFALQLRLNTRNLRAKVFIRHDMLASAPQDFPDSSKLTSNAADLTWSTQDLYGLFFQHLGNSPESVAKLFREHTGRWKETHDRFVPPRELVGSAETQGQVFREIAGPYMGNNHRKGHTYPWLPNHLADGNGQTSPRTFLAALQSAATKSASMYEDHQYALHWDTIRQGVQRASQIRVDELREDQPWVANAIEPLKGNQVPIEQDAVLEAWRARGTVAELVGNEDDEESAAGPVASTHEGLVKELIELGMMTRRNDGRLDLPDVYRIAFNLGRKGGVPRVRR
ncbi:hypothetical protein [Amycolatopsis aidingensis]|uniref:hypothetical protein n=1 Tax=Amycolatopsis aidingensis TaxID=2842453 RepID=UPI001C0CF0A5|nr:hypothetical protein [Amycolatopsis aidingensis]